MCKQDSLTECCSAEQLWARLNATPWSVGSLDGLVIRVCRCISRRSTKMSATRETSIRPRNLGCSIDC
eukprot:4237535-Amphidinium_carterae.1